MLHPHGYREYRPGPELADIVECIWTANGERSLPFRILPDGCMDIVFDFTAPPDRGGSVIGAMRRVRLAAPQQRVDFLGVRFRPGGMTACFRLDAAPFTDKRIDLVAVWPQARVIWNRLGETPAPARPAMLEAQLRALRNTKPDALVSHCVRSIEAAGGRLRMAHLERATAVNARLIERRFAAHVGISPKRLARVVRFKTAMAMIGRGRADWAALAVDCGYADQPHLVREFKELSGLTPVEAASVGNLQDAGRSRP